MSVRQVLVLGSGKRVREAALPALQALDDRFHVRAVLARTRKHIDVRGVGYDVAPLSELSAAEIATTDLVSCAVSKDSVPSVLAALTRFDVGHMDLLIDTPVVRFKHFRHTALLARFRNVWVAEDCTELPWLDTVRAASSLMGGVSGVLFHRSAYAYHGVAMSKAVLGVDRVRRGRRRRIAGGAAQRELTFAGGVGATIVEPRDYGIGHIELYGERAHVSDQPSRARGACMALETIVDGTRLLGFRIGAVETGLDPHEIELARGDPAQASVTARMDALKRVGFLRLLRNIDAGRGAYPLASALEDTVVDYHLEKFGRWYDTPLTSPHSGLARALLGAFSRLAGG